jgi:hypothetical protein
MRAKSMRARFWVEVIFAALAFALMVLTLVTREWIEELTGKDPDGGDGSLEWFVVVACAVVALVTASWARREWRRVPQPV